MLHIQTLRDQPEWVAERLLIKNFDAAYLIEQILDIDGHRRNTQRMLDDHLAESNKLSKEVAILYKEGKRDEAEELKRRSQELKSAVKGLESGMGRYATMLHDLMVQLPNLPHDLVPPGKTPEENALMEEYGDMPTLTDQALPHWELATRYGIIDFETGAKVTGSGFPFYVGKGARLQRALIAFFLDRAVEAGYLEHQTPLMVNEDSAYGTGQLPDKDGQMYHAPEDKLWLIPTAEVPLTNIYRDRILHEDNLPVKICAYSPCFRREAGSYGKDVRGLNRLHQFDKVEIVQVTTPEHSWNALEGMRNHVAGLLKELGLPFRVLRLCGGDMSFAAAMTYDFEVWSAAQKRWLEVSSVSNFEAFQANRMKLRYKNSDGKTQLAHTLNGSALALPRIVAALLENNQQEQGILIPEVLRPYTGFELIN
jgi:seryl-tRNA synthetase